MSPGSGDLHQCVGVDVGYQEQQSTATIFRALPYVGFIASALCLLYVILVAIATYRRRILPRDYCMPMSRALADHFTTLLVAVASATAKHATFVVVAACMHIATFGFIHVSATLVAAVAAGHRRLTLGGVNCSCNVWLLLVVLTWVASIAAGVVYIFAADAVLEPIHSESGCVLASCGSLLKVWVVVLAAVAVAVIAAHWALAFKSKYINHRDRMIKDAGNKVSVIRLIAYGAPLAWYTIVSALLIIVLTVAANMTYCNRNVDSYKENMRGLETLAAVTVLVWMARAVSDVITGLLADYGSLVICCRQDSRLNPGMQPTDAIPFPENHPKIELSTF